jgi:ADP-dependent NAD(P)H-hydrate dehydratase
MSVELITDLPLLPPRDPLGHKGTFGTVLVIGGHVGVGEGDRTMLGAPALAATAALRAGAGLAVLAMHEDLLAAGLTLCPAATGIALPADGEGRILASAAAERIDAVLASASVLVLGPGLGQGFAEQQLVVRLLAQEDVPIVLDADGINALATLPDGQRDIRAAVIATPHPGEFARLAASLDMTDVDPVDPERRVESAAKLARRLGAIVVLKGAGTVVSDGLRAWVNSTGNAALATGGSGDVLAGLIGGAIAQFARRTSALSLFDAARLAVLLHGLAADRWAARQGTAGMLPSDLADEVPEVMAAMRNAHDSL